MRGLANFLSRSKLFDGSESASPFGTPLGPPQLHHHCMAVYGVQWRLTAVGDLFGLGADPTPLPVRSRERAAIAVAQK
jgi:hypothetical protein